MWMQLKKGYVFIPLSYSDLVGMYFHFVSSSEAVIGEMQRDPERQRDEGMKGWTRERERWPVEALCPDWKRQWALTSVGGFGLSSCLLERPCGIRESKMNTLTHFPPSLPMLLPSLFPLQPPPPTPLTVLSLWWAESTETQFVLCQLCVYRK